MINEPNDGEVKLDNAMNNGKMGYPDILHKNVKVYPCNHDISTNHYIITGKIIEIGPLGYVMSFMGETTIHYVYFPWNFGRIEWLEENSDEI